MLKLLSILLVPLLLLPAVLAEEAGYIDPPVGFDAKVDGVTYGKTVLRSYDSTTTGRKRKVMVLPL